MTTATRNAREVTVSKSVMEQAAAAAESAIAKRSEADIAAEIRAQVIAKLEERMAQHEERVELENWWDIWALGPVQPIGNPPFSPGCVVKAGEAAYAVAVLVLNPFQPVGPTNAADLLSGFALPYEIQFQTGNLTTMAPAGAVVTGGAFVPSLYVYVAVAALPTATPGMYETNILARIMDAGGGSAPHFGGFATAILDLDSAGLFGPAAGVNFNQPIRYVVYP